MAGYVIYPAILHLGANNVFLQLKNCKQQQFCTLAFSCRWLQL